MKKYIALLFFMFSLTACTTQTTPQQDNTGIEQNATPNDSNINTDTNNTNTDVSNNTNNDTNAAVTTAVNNTNTVDEQTIQNYYKTVAEEKAIEADIEKLELDFAQGRIQKEAFQSQKTALKTQENTLESQIDILENSIPISLPSNWVDTSNMEQMIKLLKEVEIAQDQLDITIDQAEQNYINGSITREDFITQIIDLEKQNDILDKKEDILENTLEAMGWDD